VIVRSRPGSFHSVTPELTDSGDPSRQGVGGKGVGAGAVAGVAVSNGDAGGAGVEHAASSTTAAVSTKCAVQ
jgi:hypothetical protein